MTKKVCFTYKKNNPSCRFCSRTRNPHPDFDEPIVTTEVAVNGQIMELCINCYFDNKVLANNSNESMANFLQEKENISRLLKKSQNV